MAETSTENHKIVTFEHELRVEGHYLCEKKQKTVIEPENKPEEKPTNILVHIRSIDVKEYKVTQISKGDEEPQRSVDTNMTEDEVAEFEADWARLWRPKLTEKQITKLQ